MGGRWQESQITKQRFCFYGDIPVIKVFPETSTALLKIWVVDSKAEMKMLNCFLLHREVRDSQTKDLFLLSLERKVNQQTCFLDTKLHHIQRANF